MLSDKEIRQLAYEGMVNPFDEKYINPNSLDVTLGTKVLVESEETRKLMYDSSNFDPKQWWLRRTWTEVNISEHTYENPYWLYPWTFLLGHTEQVFTLPNTIAAQFHLKSSRAREGYAHALAGLCDAGWHDSVLTLELHNNASVPLPLYPGLRIGQLVFFRLAQAPDFDYSRSGRYNNDASVQISKYTEELVK